MKKIYTGIMLLFVTGNSFAENTKVYRWVDKNDVVHFSQHQPMDDSFIEISIANKDESAKDSLAPEKNAQNDIIKNSEKRKDLTNMNEMCAEAMNNVSTLTNFDNVQFTNKDGNVKILSKQEKQQQLEIDQKKTEVYCSKIKQ